MTDTIEVPISPELLEILDRHVQQSGALGRAEYVLALLREDLKDDIEAEIAKLRAADAADPPRADKTIVDILAPVHAESRLYSYTEVEIASSVDEVITATRRERRARLATEERR